MGDINIYDQHTPSLNAGIYKVKATQTFTIDGKPEQSVSPAITDLYFKVAGEQYWLDEQQIDSVYPPTGAMGDFTNILPNIILNRSTLPWERSACVVSNSKPWLALLLFTEDEVNDPLQFKTMNVTQESWEKQPFTPVAYTDANKNSFFSIHLSDDLLNIVLPSGKDPKTNPPPVNSQSYKEIEYLAHVRGENGFEKAVIVGSRMPVKDKKNILHLVSVENMYDVNGVFNRSKKNNTPGDATFGFNAFASLKRWEFFCNDHFIITPEVFERYRSQSPVNNLVNDKLSKNLEAEYFKGDDFLKIFNGVTLEAPVKKKLLATFEVAHLNSVLSHLNQTPNSLRNDHYIVYPAAFEKYKSQTPANSSVNNIISGLLGEEYVDRNEFLKVFATLQLDDATKKSLLSNFEVKTGHIILNYKLKTGDTIKSIYQGPLVPLKIPASVNVPVAEPKINPTPADLPLAIPISNADNLLRFTTFNSIPCVDISYASAWELGRTLALKDKNFSIALFQWKRNCYQLYKTVNKTPGNSPVIPVYPPMPQLVIDWFTSLMTLNNIPFNYLVPTEDYLPFESIRFFTIDSVWLQYLADGAFSLARISSKDVTMDISMYLLLQQATTNMALPRSGFFVRSVAVSGWPNMVMDVFPDISQQQQVSRVKISPNLLLCLSKNVITEVDFYQQPGSVHFGFEEKDSDPLKLQVDGKNLDSIPYDTINKKVNIASLFFNTDQSISVQATSVAQFASFLVQKIEKVKFIIN